MVVNRERPHPGCFNRQPSKAGYWAGGGKKVIQLQNGKSPFGPEEVIVTRAVWVEDRGSPECHIVGEPRCDGCEHQPKDPCVPHP